MPKSGGGGACSAHPLTDHAERCAYWPHFKGLMMGVDKGCQRRCLDAFGAPIKAQRQYALDLMLTRYGHQECGQYKDKMISVSKTLYNISNGTSDKGFVPFIRPRGTPWIATQETTPDQCASCQNCKGKGNAIPCQVFF